MNCVFIFVSSINLYLSQRRIQDNLPLKHPICDNLVPYTVISYHQFIIFIFVIRKYHNISQNIRKKSNYAGTNALEPECKY